MAKVDGDRVDEIYRRDVGEYPEVQRDPLDRNTAYMFLIGVVIALVLIALNVAHLLSIEVIAWLIVLVGSPIAIYVLLERRKR